MNKTRIISLLLVLGLLLACFGCSQNNQNNPDKTSEPDSSQVEPEKDDAGQDDAKEADPDTAMDNFVKKLQAGNYVIEPKDYAKTTVYSPELVYFTHYPGSILNVAFITHDGETFECYIDEDALTDVAFVAPGNAIDAVSFLLPNHWITLSDGNMWDLFYNNVDNPLEFTSKDENVKTTLLGLAGYGELALSTMEEVHVLLDAEDPSSVRFTAKIGDAGMIHYDDLDLTLQFGRATSDSRIDEWLKNPTYPPTRTAWTREDIAMMGLVFMRDYGETTVPFPDFASYALIFDPDAYMERTQIEISDAHATEQNLEDYIKVLTEQGYEKVSTTMDGSDEEITVYRKLLREEKGAYAELYPYYDNGFKLIGGMHYDVPEYEGIAAINEPLRENGFAELADTDVFSGWKASDTAAPRTEGWAYFFNYKLYLPMRLEYEDRDAAETYLKEYGNRMAELGYKEAYNPDGGAYENANGFKSFKYSFSDEDQTVVLEFKNEISLTPEEANKLIQENGLPEANLHGDIGFRDTTPYYHETSGFEGLHALVYQPFSNTEEAEKYLDEYTDRMEDLGYIRVNPENVGCYRSFVYYNEELRKWVGFDLINYDDHASVTLEFFSYGGDDILNNALSGSSVPAYSNPNY